MTSKSDVESVQNQLAAERAAYRQRKAALGAILNEDNNNPVSEAQDAVIQHAQNLQQKNADTLANTLRIAYQTNDIADDTQLKLQSQTNQMSRMDVALDNTNASLTRSDRTIRGLKSFSGRIANYFTSPKKHKSNIFQRPDGASATNEVYQAVKAKQQRALQNGTMYGSEYYKDKVSKAQSDINSNGLNTLLPQEQQQQIRNNNNVNRQSTGSDKGSAVDDIASLGLDGSADIDRKQNKTLFNLFKKKKPPVKQPVRERIEATPKEREAIDALQQNKQNEDAALDELSDVLKHIQLKATDMNKELHLQNQMITHIDTQVNGTSDRIKKNNAKIRDILS